MTFSPAAAETMLKIAEALKPAEEPWWIIGSAAIALHGARPINIADIDLLLGRKDAIALLQRVGVSPVSESNALFRSEIFGRWSQPPLRVEIMAGFLVRVGAEWRPVRPSTREAVLFRGESLYVPSVRELIEHCRLFGRAKDADREKLLRKL